MPNYKQLPKRLEQMRSKLQKEISPWDPQDYFSEGFTAGAQAVLDEAEKLAAVLEKHQRIKELKSGELITEDLLHELYETKDTKQALKRWAEWKGEDD